MSIKVAAVFVAATLAVATLSPRSSQALTEINFSGQIDTLNEPGNPLGITIGDPFGAQLIYDETLLSNVGIEILNQIIDSSFAFNLTIGAWMFDETQDINSPTFPEYRFLNGDLASAIFLSETEFLSGRPFQGLFNFEGRRNGQPFSGVEVLTSFGDIVASGVVTSVSPH